MLYNAFINSNFLYCANVWHFGLISNFWRLEKLNKRALRIVMNDHTSSYPELLKKARCNSIYVQNVHVILVECYKYINDINPNILLNVFNLRNHPYNTRGLQMLQLPQASTEKHGINSFKYLAPKLWNSLPDVIKSASDVNDFKYKIKNWIPQCSCGSCILCRLYLVWWTIAFKSTLRMYVLKHFMNLLTRYKFYLCVIWQCYISHLLYPSSSSSRRLIAFSSCFCL